jgi:APA family basic amino acid/polyamine antiporter
VLGFAAPTAVIARLAANYLVGPVAGPWQDVAEPGLAFALIAACAFAHGLGRNESAGAQALTTLAKLVVLIGMALVGFLSGGGDWTHFNRGGWPAQAEWPALAGSLVYVGYAYAGWNAAAYLTGEMRDPARMVPRALVGGCLLVGALYLALNVLYIYAIDPAAFADMPMGDVGRVAELAMTTLCGPGIGRGLSLVLGLGLVASVSAYLMSGSRVLAAMAADGAFFPMAGNWHAARGTPVGGIVCLGASACLLACSGSFLQLLDYTSTGLTAVSALVVAAIFPLRRRMPSAAGFRMPLYPLPPLLVLGLSTWTVAAVLMQPEKRLPALLSLGTIAAGIPLAGWLIRNKK